MTTIVTLATYNPSQVRPGWVAFWIVLALAVATFLLWRNMNSQLRKIKAPYKHELDDGAQSPADHSDEENDGSTTTP
jgi:hypothetical protein